MNDATESVEVSAGAELSAHAVSPANAVPPLIIACPDGPLLIRGTVDLRTVDGEVIPQVRPTIALCRCGVSTIKPFCDGTHKLVNFQG